ncbi:MAG: zinc-dependent peptidase [Ferruginibacter sp.]
MLRDTIWYNNGNNFLLIDDQIKIDSNYKAYNIDLNGELNGIPYSYNQKNSKQGDSILKIISKNSIITETELLYRKEKDYYDNLSTNIEMFIALLAIVFIFYATKRAKKYKENPFVETEDWVEIGTSQNTIENDGWVSKPIQKKYKPNYLTYYGNSLKFTEEQITTVLQKRFPYFSNLSFSEKTRFLARHKKFMKSKIFKIHDKSGYKEMPILLSATAIQFSFGLEEYLLPHYQFIHIFPDAFLGIVPTLRFLEGNVSGNTINISWNHYLQGNQDPKNGQNVGLHEIAHAYHFQNILASSDNDKNFANDFPKYFYSSNKIFELEKNNHNSLYSTYAFKNAEEFWAESVEIFFEKPSDLKEKYPTLYNNMCILLNQYPI